MYLLDYEYMNKKKNIGVAILAAGNSKRFGGNKLLYEVNGKKVVSYIMDEVSSLGLDSVIVSQYHEIEEIAKGIRYIQNDDSDKGISESIKLATKEFYDKDAILYVVADQINMKAKTLKKIIANYDQHKIVASSYNDEIFNPMLFPKCYYDEILALSGDKGAKRIALKHDVIKVEVNQCELKDIDTVEDITS